MYLHHSRAATHTFRRWSAVVVTGLALAAGGLLPTAVSAQADADSRTRVILLGSGTPNSDPERSGPSLAIVVDSVPYIVDAGPGLVRRAAEMVALGESALASPRLATVFLTHLHSDHTVGLPDLFLTPWVLERNVPLRVVGPIGTERMMYHLREAYSADIQNRLYGLEPANDQGHRIEATDSPPGIVYQDERVTVTAFEVDHGTWPRSQSYGYRFQTPDKVIVVSGDAIPSQTVIEQCDGCDILIHEVYAKSGWDRRDEVWQRYHAASHTSGLELGELAAEARPRLLVLTHQLLWGATPDELLAEIRQGFSGRIHYGNDRDIIRD